MEILFENEMFVTITGLILFFTLSLILNFIEKQYNKFKKKPKSPNITLNCGIWAWSGKNSSDFNKSKFDILGLYNDSRGGQGTGIFKDGEIIKSSKEKLYKDFLSNLNYNNDLKNPVIFGHARKSSSGTVSDKNTHPFGFGENSNGDYEFAGVHNGTLYNDTELAELFSANHMEIDSHILLESIYKSKSFKVLNEYIGAAALVFVNTEIPNTIYAFRGESAKYEHGRHKVEERPLYYYQETNNSLYISSIMESLTAITENEKDIEKIHEFEANKVYKIENGNVKRSQKFIIDRSKAFQRDYTGGVWSNYHGYNNVNKKNEKDKKNKIDLNKSAKKINKSTKKDSKKFNIFKESLKRPKKNGGVTHFERFKYQRNGHPVTGIYLNNIFSGLIFLDEDFVDAIQEFNEKYVGHYFDINKEEFVKNLDNIKHDNYYIPYPAAEVENLKELPFIYISDGYRVCLKEDYNAIINKNLKVDSYNMQFCSYYPVLHNKEVFHKGERILHDRINPVGSDFIYTIVSGKVVSRKKTHTPGLLKTINSSLNIVEADEKYLSNSLILFDNESYDTKFKRGDYSPNKTLQENREVLFDKYLVELEDEVNTNSSSLFNIPNNIEEATVVDEVKEHENKNIDSEYNAQRIINYTCKKLLRFANKYALKKIDLLRNLDDPKAKKIIKLTDNFIKELEILNKEENKISATNL